MVLNFESTFSYEVQSPHLARLLVGSKRGLGFFILHLKCAILSISALILLLYNAFIHRSAT